jgi:hypothetical protein
MINAVLGREVNDREVATTHPFIDRDLTIEIHPRFMSALHDIVAASQQQADVPSASIRQSHGHSVFLSSSLDATNPTHKQRGRHVERDRSDLIRMSSGFQQRSYPDCVVNRMCQRTTLALDGSVSGRTADILG